MFINILKSDLLMSLSEAVDLISPLVANHHKQVACIAYYLSLELGYSHDAQIELVYAAALHDIGITSLTDRLSTLKFDYYEDKQGHCEKGYLLLNTYKSFSDIAKIVRYHHTMWNYGRCNGYGGETIPYSSHVLHIADRISVLMKNDRSILMQAEDIRNSILETKGTQFVPELVDAFLNVSKKEYFWLDSITVFSSLPFHGLFEREVYSINEKEFHDVTKLYSTIIDFRSPFTATHSAGVAHSAQALAQLTGFSQRDSDLMKTAGLIHDLGKLAVPTEILEKPSSLNKEEYNIVKTHTYYTNKILLKVQDFNTIREWGAFHHERLDGKGYPFHLSARDLSVGSRIMAVVDVFVAITEDRPYRRGMEMDQALQVLRNMVSTALDGEIVNLLVKNIVNVNAIRITAQKEASAAYRLTQKTALLAY
ncbi:MAG: hypothetical protein BGN88_14395 [Clostridiales bacterium 43-6]|mgnify:CR=1 FL=1|nr:MAG: hypothetical protein BGN88_14395 [Clostridiales bacterium 43-6]